MKILGSLIAVLLVVLVVSIAVQSRQPEDALDQSIDRATAQVGQLCSQAGTCRSDNKVQVVQAEPSGPLDDPQTKADLARVQAACEASPYCDDRVFKSIQK